MGEIKIGYKYVILKCAFFLLFDILEIYPYQHMYIDSLYFFFFNFKKQKQIITEASSAFFSAFIVLSPPGVHCRVLGLQDSSPKCCAKLDPHWAPYERTFSHNSVRC